MDIRELIQTTPNVSITIGANDLMGCLRLAIKEAKEEWEAAITAKKTETYVSPAKASEQLHVDKSTLWRYGKNGYLVPVEVGGKRLYKQSDIDKILRKQKGVSPMTTQSITPIWAHDYLTHYKNNYLGQEIKRKGGDNE